MKSRTEILAILRRMLPELAHEFGVTRLAVFGSVARDEATLQSDVDLLVDVDPSIGLRFVDLAEELEAALGLRVDLVSRRALNPRHFASIERDLLDVA